VTTVAIAGIGMGVGVLGLVAALRRQRQSLDFLFDTLDREPAISFSIKDSTGARLVGSSRWRLDRTFAGQLEATLKQSPRIVSRIAPALSISGTNLNVLCSEVLLGSASGVLVPFVCWLLVEASGIRLSLVVPVWVALLLGLGGGALPVAFLFSEAKRCKRTARRSVGTFLDLVVLCLAGGMGIEGALHAAAAVGDDEVTIRLARALAVARDAGQTPWDALAGVGAHLGVEELVELAAAVGLAGSHGARIRSTLAAKAASIRKHELADAEAAANSVTERLFIPGVFLLVGFLLFIGYPAVERITTGL